MENYAYNKVLSILTDVIKYCIEKTFLLVSFVLVLIFYEIFHSKLKIDMFAEMLSLRSILYLSPRVMTVTPIANIMWPAKFEDPLKSRKEINDIRKTPEFERKINVPVKAALKDASCSMFIDPLLLRYLLLFLYKGHYHFLWGFIFPVTHFLTLPYLQLVELENLIFTFYFSGLIR